jgi:RNA polymerase sigma factor (sigma-70 family)
MLATSDLELLIESAYAEGHARFGDLGLDLQTYAKRIHAIVRKHLGESPPTEQAVAFVKRLHGRDLYLVTACAQESAGLQSGKKPGRPGEYSCLAWKTLGSTYKAFIHDLARLFFRQSFVAMDLADNILADLFFPDNSGTSRIMSYDGRSSLCTWLRAVLCNRAINARRHSSYSQTTEMEANIPDKPALANIDNVVRASRYGMPLADSVALACQELTAQDRLLLLWRYDEGLPLGRIAKLLGIHQSNVTRRLERMQGKLRDQITAILATKYHMGDSAIQECLKDVVENPRQAISILEFIKIPPQANKNPVARMAPIGTRHSSAPGKQHRAT